MKARNLKTPAALVEVMPMGGWQSCLPPQRLRPPKATRPVIDFANMSDAELMKLEPVANMLKEHDWYHDFSDDPSRRQAGRARRNEILAALAALPEEQAEALWGMYAPKALGSLALQQP